MKPYRMLDLEYLGCSNPIVGRFDTLEEMMQEARDYDKSCEGDCVLAFAHYENDEWTMKEYNYWQESDG